MRQGGSVSVYLLNSPLEWDGKHNGVLGRSNILCIVILKKDLSLHPFFQNLHILEQFKGLDSFTDIEKKNYGSLV